MLHGRFALLSATLLALALTTQAAQQAPVAKDALGDPLPEGAVARLGSLRWRHGGATAFCAFLPDGKTVLSVARDRVARIWEYPSGKELHRFTLAPSPASGQQIALIAPPGRAGNALPIALSPDGKTLAVSFDRNPVSLFDVASGKKLPSLKMNDTMGARGISGLTFSPDGKELALLELNGSMQIWDWARGEKLRTINGSIGGPIFAVEYVVVYSPDGKTLVTTKAEIIDNQFVQSLKIWNAATGNAVRSIALDGQIGNALPPAFSPDSKTLAYTNAAGTITLLEAATGKEIRKWKLGRPVYFLMFGTDAGKLYTRTAGENFLMEWNAASGEELRKVALHLSPLALRSNLRALHGSLSPNGKILAFAGVNNALQFVDLVAGKDIPVGEGHETSLVSVTFTPDGKHLFSRGSDGAIRKWEAATGKALGQVDLPPTALRGVISPDGKLLATVAAGGNGSRLLDAVTGKELGTLPIDGRNGNQGVLFSPDSKILAVRLAQEKKIVLVEMPSCKVLQTVVFAAGGSSMGGPGGGLGGPAGRAPSNLMLFSPDGKTLAAFADASTLGLWDIETGLRVGSMKLAGPNPVVGGAFSPDGRCLALDFHNGTVALYELASGQVRRTFGTKIAKEAPPKGMMSADFPVVLGGGTASPPGEARVAFAPDGKTLLYGGADHVLRIWDATTGKQLAAFTGHGGDINAITLAPNGKTAVTASADTTCLVWDLSTLAPTPIAQKALGAAQRDACWQGLLGDGAGAFASICDLSGAPAEAMALIQANVHPAAPLDGKRVLELIVALDSNQFKERQEASAELLKMGERVVPALTKALADNPPLEVKQRLDQLRKQLTSVVLEGERLRAYRAIEVLERIGTAEARQVLQMLGDGAPGAMVTTTAQAALKRLGQGK